MVKIRKIQPQDNPLIASIIRKSLEEYGENKPGTVYTDPTTDTLYEMFEQTKKSSYFVLIEDGEVIGGSGIFPTEGLPEGHVELVKIYLKKESRGKGYGKQLLEECLKTAKTYGYSHVYLESFPSLKEAIQLYKINGFERIDHALGNSGHFACDVWMVKEL